MILDSDKRPEINYPCEWSYKVIGNNIDRMLEAIESAVSGLNYDVTPSNISKNGNYYSLNLSLIVPNEVVRDLIYQKLDSSESIKIVF
jgi:putative lipoic acid-binding regulatory protein